MLAKTIALVLGLILVFGIIKPVVEDYYNTGVTKASNIAEDFINSPFKGMK